MAPAERSPAQWASVVEATRDQEDGQDRDLLTKARDFAAPLLTGHIDHSGENFLRHADGVAQILCDIGGSASVQAAIYLSYASRHLNQPQRVLADNFGEEMAKLAVEASKLEHVQARSRQSLNAPESGSMQLRQETETVRKMLLAFSRDLRVVLLRLASRLQTLRYCAEQKIQVAPAVLSEAAEVFAPLANRLGIWQIKWQMEDLIFRAQEPDFYREIACRLNSKRAEREARLEQRRLQIETALHEQGIAAKVSGRPKHISSIARKMRGKNLKFEQVMDIRALRIIVETVAECYSTLDWVQQHYESVPSEFDDYIAKPKLNGYQSIHTVVRDEEKQAWEVQIRTWKMHHDAESGVAAHWAYKEAGAKGYAGVSASSAYDAKIAALRQLLAWRSDLSAEAEHAELFEDRIYVLTPQATVIELTAGATPVDFAYSVHTEVGHRCRGARVDGVMVPLNTPLKNGQTVEITTAKQGGPSRDWLNPELGYLVSSRAKAKVRAWFNAQHQRETIARGREMVEKLLQRHGRTAMSLDDLADSLGFKSPEALFETVGKDEFSMRSIEAVWQPAPSEHDPLAGFLHQQEHKSGKRRGGVLVVGMDSLLTQPARCCSPAPPDEIAGYVTRGRGVSIHRSDCKVFADLKQREPERSIEVAWGETGASNAPRYPVAVSILAAERATLLRDISDIFAREKMNVTNVDMRSHKNSVKMKLTIEVNDTARLQQILRQVEKISGVRSAQRI